MLATLNKLNNRSDVPSLRGTTDTTAGGAWEPPWGQQRAFILEEIRRAQDSLRQEMHVTKGEMEALVHDSLLQVNAVKNQCFRDIESMRRRLEQTPANNIENGESLANTQEMQENASVVGLERQAIKSQLQAHQVELHTLQVRLATCREELDTLQVTTKPVTTEEELEQRLTMLESNFEGMKRRELTVNGNMEELPDPPRGQTIPTDVPSAHQSNDKDTLPQSSHEFQQPVGFNCGGNLHAWCIVHATWHLANPRCVVSFIAPIIIMSSSAAFVIMQLFLLASCILESSFQRCSIHDHCNLGEWCSPALAGIFSTAPGVCFDCWSAEMFYKARFLGAPYEVYPDPYELMADAAGDKWLHDGSLHCNMTDTMARRCDYLVHNLENVTPLSMLIFIATSGLIVASLIDELDEAEECELLSVQIIITQSKKKHRYIVMAMSWFICSLRRWVLPMMTLGAFLAVVLRQPLTGSNLLLNGLSIAFITELDDSLISLIYFPSKSAVDLPTFAVSVRTWIFHRVYAMQMCLALLLCLLDTEYLLVAHGNEAKYGAVCSDLREIVLVPCFYVCFLTSILHAFLRWYLRFRVKEDSVPDKLSSQMSSLELGFQLNGMVLDLTQFTFELLIPPFLVWYFRSAFVAQGPLVLLQIGDPLRIA